MSSNHECRNCFQTKPASEFTRALSRRSGFDKYCRQCHAERRSPAGRRTKGCQKCRNRLPIEEFPLSAGARHSPYCRSCRIRSEKSCSRCGLVQTLDHFGRTRHFDGRDTICRVCRRAERVWTTPNMPDQKRCGKCGEMMRASSFTRNSQNRDGLERLCRTCYRERLRARTIADPPPEKVCKGKNGCGRALPRSAFNKDVSRPDKKAPLCRECAYRAKQKYQKWDRPGYRQSQQRYARSGKGVLTRLRANARGLEVDLPEAEFLAWYDRLPRGCSYCGVKEEHLSAWLGTSRRKFLDIDRVDNARGYVIGNLVLACGRCNRMKGSLLSAEEMKWVAEQYLTPELERLFPDDSDYRRINER